MKKIAIRFLVAAASILSVCCMMNMQGDTMTPGNGQPVHNGPFNEVRIVCLPKHRSSDQSMKKIGVNRKISTVMSENGRTVAYECYIAYYYNTEIEPYGKINCALGRQRVSPHEYDIVYGSLQQAACGINIIHPGIIADKIKNPLNHAVFAENLMDAIQYLTTGE